MLKTLSFLVAAFLLVGSPHVKMEQHESFDHVAPTVVEPTDGSSGGVSLPNVFQKKNFASYYFNKLVSNTGYNKFGSCSYVATEMLLSFYDTYWNDDFIPESYETVADTTNVDGDFRRVDQSPGSHHEDRPTASNRAEYEAYVEANKSDHVHLELLSIGINQYGIGQSSTSSYSLGTWLSTIVNVLNIYLDNISNLSSDDVDIYFHDWHDYTQQQFRQEVINKVQAGIPVIIDGYNPTSGGAHSYIAYDYDEENDEIYCNAGWQQSYRSHIAFSSLGYTQFQEILYIDPMTHHYESNNYFITEGEFQTYFCPLKGMLPQVVEGPEQFYAFENPTFAWNTFVDDGYLREYQAHYRLSILDEQRNTLVLASNILDNEYTLTDTEYQVILSLNDGEAFYVHVELYSPVQDFSDEYAQDIFYRNILSELAIGVTPSQWNFDEQYYFTPVNANRTFTREGYSISMTTTRLRCGYIRNSYIVLSPRRANAGTAYFEMNLNTAITSFICDLSLWSDSESAITSAIIETKDENGVWSTAQNILDLNLPVKEDGHERVILEDEDGIYGVRFYATAPASGSKNKGRICIDNMWFSIETEPNA